jgi:hypothetical protein
VLIVKADVEARIGRSLTASEETSFNIVNAATQAYVERMIGSDVEEATATPRSYDGGVQHLSIDPCTDIASVVIVDEFGNTIETLDSDDYTLEPINRTLKTMVRFRYGKAIRGFNFVKVTAKYSIYGDSDILAIVKDAMISALESEVTNTDNVKRESIEGYSIEYANEQTKDALDKLKFIFPGV